MLKVFLSNINRQSVMSLSASYDTLNACYSGELIAGAGAAGGPDAAAAGAGGGGGPAAMSSTYNPLARDSNFLPGIA